MIDLKRVPSALQANYRKQFETRLAGLRAERMSFWAHWAQLAEVFLPRRYKWFVTANQYNRGAQINAAIIDETGLIDARTCAAGMMSGLTSPTKPWFKMGLHDLQYIEYGPVKTWLAEVTRRMLRVLAESNYYQSLNVLYHDNVVFGSAAQLIYEDPKEVIRCYNPGLGEFFFAASSRLDINALYREFTYTIAQLVERFGIDNVSDSSAQLARGGGANLQQEVVVQHCVEPNTAFFDHGTVPLGYLVPKKFEYREAYWETTTSGRQLLEASGYNEKPFIGARWDTVANDAYGRCPGMDAMPATRQLQVQQRRLAEAIDKMVRPPMNASVSMKNEPMSILPGAVNYVADVANSGFAPAFKVDPKLQEMNMNIDATQKRIHTIFFVDLFMMISQLDTVRTATEIDARREEKLIQLGPVVERFENEVLDPALNRVFSIMWRKGLIPPPPQEIRGMPLNIQYTSMLAEAQRAASTSAIERLLQVAGGIAGVAPDAMDNIDIDAVIERYADLVGADPDLIRPLKQVMAIRQQRAQQQQQEQALAATPGLAQAASNLSDTKLGGGQNALQLMMQ